MRHALPALTGLALVLVLLAGCGEPPTEAREGEIPVSVSLVAIDQRSNSPMILLDDVIGGRSLPIWIGFAEARSIAAEMGRDQPPRPNTHDLTKRLVDALSGDVERVVVTELRNGTYYAILVLSSNGTSREVDSRPSDAIALGLRYGAPLFVREALLESASGPPDPEPEERSI